MSDKRYGSVAWKRVRVQILNRDGYTCRVQGPRCTGRATTVHHRVASSVRPDLFFAADNLEASCRACNFADGARLSHANARDRRAELQELREIVDQQAETIEELLARLAHYEQPEPAKPRLKPAIY